MGGITCSIAKNAGSKPEKSNAVLFTEALNGQYSVCKQEQVRMEPLARGSGIILKVKQQPLQLLLMDNKLCASVCVWSSSGEAAFLGTHEPSQSGCCETAGRGEAMLIWRGREAEEGEGVTFPCVYIFCLL